jgi:hypothetical protein
MRARFIEHYRQPSESRRVSLCRQLGVGCPDQHEFILHHRGERQHAGLGGHCHQPDIETVILDKLDDVGGSAGGHGDLERRETCAQVAQDWRQEMDTGGRASTDAHAPEGAGRVARHGVERGHDACLDVPYMKQQFGPSRRGRRPAAAALNEAHLEALLELAHLLADGGLRQIQPRRRRGETAQLDHIGKGSQLIGMNTTHQKQTLM